MPDAPAAPQSPRIAALQAAFEKEGQAALNAFWEEIAAQGTPLFEPLPDDAPNADTHTLMTLVWQAEADHQHVLAFSALGDLTRFETMKMERLGETRLWHKTYVIPRDLRTTYRFAPDEPLQMPDDVRVFIERLKNHRPDPHNANVYTFYDPESEDFKEPMISSVLEGPHAVPQTYHLPRADVPAGTLEMHRFKSGILGNERRVWLYTPPNYDPDGEPCGLLLCFDGFPYTNGVPTHIILDNLIAEGKIPPMVAVLPDSINQEYRSRELPCHKPFVDFLATELIPWVRQCRRVSLDPARSVVAGSSYGGLASAFVGRHLWYIFGNVLSQSGSYWWTPEGDPEGEWLTRQFASSDRLPLRFYLDIGQIEMFDRMVITNRHMRTVLQAKGYPVTYAEFSGGHDYICWRGTLVDGLLALVGEKP